GATWPRGSECTLPCSAVISSAISSRCASSSSRYLNRIAVRRASEEAPQVVKASLAAATAASTSSAVANATCFSWTPVAGFQTGPKRPEVPSTGLPPMKWLMVFMCCDGPFGRRGVLQVAAADGDLALVLLAGPDGRLAAGHLGHRHVPPRLGGGSGGRRVGLDVHARRAGRGAGLGERGPQFAHRLGPQHLHAEAGRVGRQVDGQRGTGEGAVGGPVAVGGAVAFAADRLRQAADGRVAVVLDQHDVDRQAFLDGG